MTRTYALSVLAGIATVAVCYGLYSVTFHTAHQINTAQASNTSSQYSLTRGANEHTAIQTDHSWSLPSRPTTDIFSEVDPTSK